MIPPLLPAAPPVHLMVNQDNAASSASQESANSGPTPTPEEEQEIPPVQGVGQTVPDQGQISTMSPYDEIVQRR